MRRSKYLIVGGGIAADAAAAAIRDEDPDGTIALVGDEPHAPYNRPPLSKALWKGEPITTIDRPAVDDVELRLGRRIVSLDPDRGVAIDDRGEEHGFERVLLATGGRPRRLPGGAGAIHFRTRDDYARLRAVSDAGGSFVVVGAGFIGSELAAALAMNGRRVHLVFPEEGLGARVFPRELSRWLVGFYREHGVETHPGTTVQAIEADGARHTVRLSDGSAITVDGVVAGIGLVPNDDLAREAGLRVDDGILVDEYLRASHPSVWAAGDVARIPSAALGGTRRVEHEDAALASGRAAGLSMAGKGEPFRHLAMFYSDLFDLGYEAVGDVDARLDTVADWKQPFREGVVYYLDGEHVRGVLLVNTWGKVDEARALVSGGPVPRDSLKGRLG